MLCASSLLPGSAAVWCRGTCSRPSSPNPKLSKACCCCNVHSKVNGSSPSAAQEHLGCLLSLDGHTDIVLSLDALEVGASSGGGDACTLLLSGSKDNSMRLWEAPSGRCLGATPIQHPLVGPLKNLPTPTFLSLQG